MPKLNTSEEELKKMFNELEGITKSFSSIDAKAIENSPKFIRIFRLILGTSLKEFSGMLSKTYAAISQYERKKIKKIPKIEAERIIEIIKKKLPEKIDFNIVKKNFQKFYELSKGGVVQGIIRAELGELTEQEKKIEKELKKLKIEFEKHKTFKTEIGPLNFDFWIPYKNIIIECTKSATKDKAESLSYRIYKLKQTQNIKSVAIIDKRVSRGFIRRLSEFDHVIYDDKLSKLKSVL